MGFASGPYTRIYRTLRKANRPPRRHHHAASAPEPGATVQGPHLDATRRWRRRAPRRNWPMMLAYVLAAVGLVALILRSGLLP